MDELNKLMQADMQKLDQVIRADLKSEIVLINQVSEYIISAGGKRIRPLLTLLCGRICGFDSNTDVLYKMAAMIEYIHTATLLHDDVVDESGFRRGRQTANAVFGNAASVLVGDFIYTRAFQMMLNGNSLRLMQIMADCTNRVSEGEVLQLLNIGNSKLSYAEYFAVIKAKTGALFEAAARVAVIVSGGDAQFEENLAEYALNLGIVFQIIDDILDYSGDAAVLGKNIGDDLLEGKVTLPLLYLLNHGSIQDKEILVAAIDKPATADLEQIIKLVKESGALEFCRHEATKYMNLAITALEIFPDSLYRTAMIDLIKSSLERIK